MKIRRNIILVFLITLGIILVHQTFRLITRTTSAEHLGELTKELINDVDKSKNLYFLSNNSSTHIYFMTQFVCVPNTLIKKNYEEVPPNGLILMVNDLSYKDSSLTLNPQTQQTELLNSQTNLLYKIDLVKKK